MRWISLLNDWPVLAKFDIFALEESAVQLLHIMMYELWPVTAFIAVGLAYLLSRFDPAPKRKPRRNHMGQQVGSKKNSQQYLGEFALESLLSLDDSLRQMRQSRVISRLRDNFQRSQQRTHRKKTRSASETVKQ